MKVAIQCRSPLLQKSLEIFLQPYLSSVKQCDVVLRDYKVHDEKPRSLYIASGDDADIKKPFSQTELTLMLQKILKEEDSQCHESGEHNTLEVVPAAVPQQRSFEALEMRIQTLTREYQDNIMKAVRTFYES